MSKWEKVRLGDIFKVTSGGTPSKSKPEYYKNGSIQWIRTGDLKSKYITKASNLITEEALRNSSAKLFPIDTVLIAMYGATIGACSILAIEATTNQACAAFLPNKKVDSSYLYYFLCSKKNELIKLSVGGAQPNISGTILKGISIPVPPLEVQKKIAQILDAASELIALRKKQLAELDNLIKSTFCDMFDDPVTNEKGWMKTKLDEVCEKITDGEHSTPRRAEKGIYLLSARNIHNHEIKLNDVDFIDLDEYERISKRIIPMENDILISCSGSVGRVCRVKGNLKFQMVRSVAILKLKSNINSVFIEYLIDSSYVQKQILRSINQSSQANLFQGKIKKLEIILPPLSLQNQFAEIVTKIEEQKSLVQKAIDESQYLFDSLMSEYFE